MLDRDNMAPNFSLPATDDQILSLETLRQDGPVVVFFYPKDDTSGCTVENQDFSRLLPEFRKAGVTVVGISPDSVKKHDKFRQKHELTVDLAADEEKVTLQDYGVWVEKSMYGRKYMGVERSTFLIGQDGRIVDLWRKVKVPGHADAVLEAAKMLVSKG